MPLKEYLNLFVWQFICFTKNLTKVSYFKKTLSPKYRFNAVSIFKNIHHFASAFWTVTQPSPHQRKWTVSGNVICWKVRVEVFSLPSFYISRDNFTGRAVAEWGNWKTAESICRCEVLFSFTPPSSESLSFLCCVALLSTAAWTPLVIVKLGKSYSLQAKAKPHNQQSDDTEWYYSSL